MSQPEAAGVPIGWSGWAPSSTLDNTTAISNVDSHPAVAVVENGKPSKSQPDLTVKRRAKSAHTLMAKRELTMERAATAVSKAQRLHNKGRAKTPHTPSWKPDLKSFDVPLAVQIRESLSGSGIPAPLPGVAQSKFSFAEGSGRLKTPVHWRKTALFTQPKLIEDDFYVLQSSKKSDRTRSRWR
jgi:hypothetical protein